MGAVREERPSFCSKIHFFANSERGESPGTSARSARLLQRRGRGGGFPVLAWHQIRQRITEGSASMKERFLVSILILVAGVTFSAPVDAATITAAGHETCAGVYSGVGPHCSISINMVFGPSEAPQAFQLSIDLVDSIGNATTGAGVFTVGLTSATGGWHTHHPSLSPTPGTGNVIGTGQDLSPKTAGQTIQAFEISLTPTGGIGILSFSVEWANSFWSPDGMTQTGFTSSSIHSFSTIPVPEPSSILMVSAGLAAVGLTRRKKT